MRFETLAEAIDIVNQTGYGLTSGLAKPRRPRTPPVARRHPRRQPLHQPHHRGRRRPPPALRRHGQVGLRSGDQGRRAQLRRRVHGPGRRRGRGGERPAEARRSAPGRPMQSAAGRLVPCPPPSCRACWPPWAVMRRTMREEFGRQHDHFRLVGQDNFRRYLPVRRLRSPHRTRPTRPSRSSPASRRPRQWAAASRFPRRRAINRRL